jgi:hypothetical protein
MSVLIFSLLILLTSNYGDKINEKTVKLDSVQYSLDVTTLNYSFENETDNKELQLVPINNIQAGFSITKGDYSLGFGFEDPSQSEETEELGRSRAFDAQFSTTLYKHYFEVYYQKYQGLGVRFNGETKPIDYKYESLNYGFHIKHFFNEEYNPYHSLFHFGHKREENSSMVLGLTIERNIFKNNNGILPTEFNANYAEYVGVREVSQDLLGATFGYTHLENFLEKYYAQYLVSVGPNLVQANYRGGDIKDTVKTGFRANISFDLGYQFTQSLFGLSVNTYRSTLEASEESQLSYSRTKIQIYYNHFF